MHRHRPTSDGRRQRTFILVVLPIGNRCLVLGAFHDCWNGGCWLAAKLSGSFLPFYCCCCCWSIAISLFAVCRRVRTVMCPCPLSFCPFVRCPLSCARCLLPEVGRSAVKRLRPDHSFVKLSGHGSAAGSWRDMLPWTSSTPFRFHSCQKLPKVRGYTLF